MIKRDYILRWTKELAKVLAKLMGKRVELQLEIIHQTYDELLELDLNELDQLPLEAVLPFLSGEKQLEGSQLNFLAEILSKHGELLLKNSDFFAGRRRLQEALLIFEFLDIQEAIYSFERQAGMEKIRQTIDKISVDGTR